MGSILGNEAVKRAIQQIAVRTEREDPQEAVVSFYDCNIITHLTNFNDQIIQGRRGTGKTHILLALKNKLENENCHCIYFDCKVTGSAAEIADSSLPEKHRVVHLMRDFLYYLYADLQKYYDEKIKQDIDARLIDIELLLKQLLNECHSTGQITKEYEKHTNTRQKDTKAVNDTIKMPPLNPFTTEINYTEDRQQEQESCVAHNTSGISYGKIVFPNVNQCLVQLAKLTDKNFIILIDEWSNLPLDIQPHFAEFLKCCFMGSRRITLKIAVVKGRTQYCIRNNNHVYGFEVGAEISVAMDLDDIYMYDKNPEKVIKHLYQILLTHLKAKGVMENMDVDYFKQTLFKDYRSSILLVRASEGNPRDFISIVNNCIIEIEGIDRNYGSDNQDNWINSKIIFDAATAWYQNDKESALSLSQKQLLSEIIHYVVQQNHTRGFVIDEAYLHHEGIKGLIDARVLHVMKTGAYFPNLSKYTMAILVLDFGTYANFLRTNRNIHFLTNDVCETEVFSQFPQSQYDNRLYPYDESRKFQMCLLDPKLEPNICPSFHKTKKQSKFPGFFPRIRKLLNL